MSNSILNIAENTEFSARSVVENADLTILIVFVLKGLGFGLTDNVRAVAGSVLEFTGVYYAVWEGELAVTVIATLLEISLIRTAILILVDAKSMKIAILKLAPIQLKAIGLSNTANAVGNQQDGLTLVEQAVA